MRHDFLFPTFWVKGASKDQHDRDICRQAVQLEEEQKEQRLLETEEQLKSLRIELQKTQEQQERLRIQEETAKVFQGTVIQRGSEPSKPTRPRWRTPFRFLPQHWHSAQEGSFLDSTSISSSSQSWHTAQHSFEPSEEPSRATTQQGKPISIK